MSDLPLAPHLTNLAEGFSNSVSGMRCRNARHPQPGRRASLSDCPRISVFHVARPSHPFAALFYHYLEERGKREQGTGDAVTRGAMGAMGVMGTTGHDGGGASRKGGAVAAQDRTHTDKAMSPCKRTRLIQWAQLLHPYNTHADGHNELRRGDGFRRGGAVAPSAGDSCDGRGVDRTIAYHTRGA
jgi:hypothetical protein